MKALLNFIGCSFVLGLGVLFYACLIKVVLDGGSLLLALPLGMPIFWTLWALERIDDKADLIRDKK